MHPLPVKGPLVFEQYICWWPMEVHAGYYLLANLELHKATGEQTYLDKAKATGNAILCVAEPGRRDSELGNARRLDNGKPRAKTAATIGTIATPSLPNWR